MAARIDDGLRQPVGVELRVGGHVMRAGGKALSGRGSEVSR